MSRILRGAAANLGTIGVGVGSGLLVTFSCARAWQDLARFGEYAWRAQVAATLGLLAASGFPSLAVRYVSGALARGETGQGRRLALRLALLTLLSSALFCLLFLLLDGTTSIFERRGALLPLLGLAAAQAVAATLSALTQATGRFDLVFLASLPAVGGAAVAASLLAASGHGPDAVLGSLALGQLGLAAILAWRLPALLARGPDPGGPPGGEAARFFLGVAAIGVIDLIVWQKSEVFFLDRYQGPAEVAHYALAFAVAASLVRSAPMALGGVLTPAFAGFAGRDARTEAGPFFARAVVAMAALSAAIAVGGFALAPSLLGLLGPRYVAAFPFIPLLLAGLVAGNVSGTASTVFHGFGQAGALLRMGVVLASVNLALDFLLIPRHGAWGASIACSAAQVLSLPIAARLLRAGTGFAYPWRALGRVLLAAAVGVGLERGARLLPLPTLLSDLLAATLACAGGLYAFIRIGGPADLAARAVLVDPPPPEDPAPVVSIVIPTKNRPEYLRRALAAVYAQAGPAREVIVVDSSDGGETQALLAAEFPAVRRVRVRGMPNNRHFAKNQGIRLARGRILLFLDDDSVALPGWLERMLALYDDPAVGGAGGRILDDVFGRIAPGEVVGGLGPGGRLHLNFTRDTGRVIDVEHVIGCNMSFRAEALARVGGFDTAYGGPNLMEETDLCLRVRRAGYRIRFHPDAVVHHQNAPRDQGLDRTTLDLRFQFWTARSRAYFALKLLPRSVAVLRHNALGPIKQLVTEAFRLRSRDHLRAALRQVAGMILGAWDWCLAAFPRA